MNNDQRLIPFLGGLIVGGIGGAAFDNKQPYYGYNYPYNNIYYQYPTYYYPNNQLPINSPYNYQYNNGTMLYQQEQITPAKIINELPTNIYLQTGDRSINKDISFVPYYKNNAN